MVAQGLVVHGQHGVGLKIGETLDRDSGAVFVEKAWRNAIGAQQFDRINAPFYSISQDLLYKIDRNGEFAHRRW